MKKVGNVGAISILVSMGASSIQGQDAAQTSERIRTGLIEQARHHRVETMRENRVKGLGSGQTDEVESPEYLEGDRKPVLLVKRILVDRSQVIPAGDWEKITGKYYGRMVSVADIKDMLAGMNSLYKQRGYITCRAYLPEQDISSGQLQLALFEGHIGQLKVRGARSIRPGFVEKSLKFGGGEVFCMPEIEKKLIAFNAINDTKARIAISPGEADATTDIDIVLDDVSRFSGTVFSDNAGQETTGYYRGGMVGVMRGLLPFDYVRDFAMGGGVFSRGATSLFGSYTVTEATFGTTWNAGVDWSNTDIVKGELAALDVKGSFFNYHASVKKTLIATKNNILSLNLTGNIKRGETTISSVQMQESALKSMTLGLDDLWLFNKGFLFGNIGVTRGWVDVGEAPDFWKMNTYVEFQYGLARLYTWNTKLTGQFASSSSLPSSEQTQLGGVNSVRGYAEGMMVGEQGVYSQNEIRMNVLPFIPLYKNHLKGAEFFVFYDCGKLDYASGGSFAQFNEPFVDSIGGGLRLKLSTHFLASCTAAFPQKVHTNNEFGRGCHWLFNVTFQF